MLQHPRFLPRIRWGEDLLATNNAGISIRDFGFTFAMGGMPPLRRGRMV